MTNTLRIGALVAATIALTGCENNAETPAAEAPKAATSASNAMTSMEMPVDAKMGKATGTVTAIDAARGKITLDHGAIPTVGWPAMKMAFSAKPALIEGIKVGDKVAFDVTVTGNAGEVTAFGKQ